MEFVDILGYLGALLIGVTLGLIGGGGSILTVPILVYLLGINPVISTAYSLFVVGSTSLVGAIKNMMKGLVEIKTAIVFIIPAFIAVYLTRRYAIPAIPDELFSIGGILITKDLAIMVFFALIMFAAAISMLRQAQCKDCDEVALAEGVKLNYGLILLEGAVVGALTGLVGAGGGFLIIPALVLLAKLPMKKAVATSLLIIAVKSLIGFIGDVQNLSIDWAFLLPFTALSIIGIFVGTWLNKFINGSSLKKGFAWFVLLLAVYILYKELMS
jgi:uncharacterized protein